MRLTADQRELVARVAVAYAAVEIEQARLEQAIKAAWGAGVPARRIAIAAGTNTTNILRGYAAQYQRPSEDL